MKSAGMKAKQKVNFGEMQRCIAAISEFLFINIHYINSLFVQHLLNYSGSLFAIHKSFIKENQIYVSCSTLGRTVSISLMYMSG